jgi:hypothetical protein
LTIAIRPAFWHLLTRGVKSIGTTKRGGVLSLRRNGDASIGRERVKQLIEPVTLSQAKGLRNCF